MTISGEDPVTKFGFLKTFNALSSLEKAQIIKNSIQKYFYMCFSSTDADNTTLTSCCN